MYHKLVWCFVLSHSSSFLRFRAGYTPMMAMPYRVPWTWGLKWRGQPCWRWLTWHQADRDASASKNFCTTPNWDLNDDHDPYIQVVTIDGNCDCCTFLMNAEHMRAGFGCRCRIVHIADVLHLKGNLNWIRRKQGHLATLVTQQILWQAMSFVAGFVGQPLLLLS